MRIYLESKTLFKYKKCLLEKTKTDSALDITCNVSYGTFYKTYRLIHKKFKCVPKFCIEINHITKRVLSLFEKNKFKLQIDVSGKVPKRKINLIAKCKKPVILIDESNIFDNIKFYKNINNLVYKTNFESNYEAMLYFDLAYFNKTNMACEYDSCLGENLFIARDGETYFCYKNLSKSWLGNISDCNSLESLFENETFTNVLDKAIEKRDDCSKKCKIFVKCKGGCPLRKGDCEKLLENLTKATMERKNIFQNNIPLDKEHLFVKESIIREISKTAK